MSDFFSKFNTNILNAFGLEWGTILSSFGLGENTPAENPDSQPKKRKLIDSWEKSVVTSESNNATDDKPIEPKAKKQKLTHTVDNHQSVNAPQSNSFLINFADDTAEEESQSEIIVEPKILPPQLPQPKSIQQLNRALSQLEGYHVQKLIDLDLGDRSLNCILLPLLGNHWHDSSAAWLSDFFIMNFMKEKIASLGKKDILIYDFNPNSKNLYINMTRLAKQNKDKGINKIVWPICHDKHFYLITISYDPIKNTVYIHAVDGFNSTEQQRVYLNKANDLAELFFPDADFFMKMPQSIVSQDNMTDCALVVCYYASHFIKQTGSEFREWAYTFSTPKPIDGINTQPYTPYRKKVAESIFALGNRQLAEAQPQEEKMVINIEF